MNTFLKVVLLLIAVVIAIKLLPVMMAIGCLMAGTFFGVLALVVSGILAMLGSAIVVGVLLSPIWVPLLVVVGLIVLIKRSGRHSGGITA